MMIKMVYPRASVLAAVAGPAADERPIDELIAQSGIDPAIMEVAAAVARAGTDALLQIMADITSAAEQMADDERPGYFAREMADADTQTIEVTFLRGVLLGLGLGLQPSEGRHDQHFDALGSLPADIEFFSFDKVGHTSLARINGPFSCRTVDGNIAHCDDGWLALDAGGNLYPVADAIARDSYVVIGP